jgi:hypothetical protein
MGSVDAKSRIAEFLGRYSPEVRARLKQARRKLRALFPRGYELVFDNYNALVFAISPTESAADAFVSVAGYPRWLTLFFLRGAALDDPNGLLQGTGKQVRGVRITTTTRVDSPRVKALVRQAADAHAAAFGVAPKLRTIMKTELETQRPRRNNGRLDSRMLGARIRGVRRDSPEQGKPLPYYRAAGNPHWRQR